MNKSKINEKIIKNFNKRSINYNTYTPWLDDRKLIQYCLEPLMDMTKKCNCLDIGGGTGWIANIDHKLTGRNWVVADISEEMGKQCSDDIIFVCTDAHKLPFKSNSFEFILVRSLLQFVDISNILKEAYRVLKDECILVIAEKIVDPKNKFKHLHEEMILLRNPNKQNILYNNLLLNEYNNSQFEVLKNFVYKQNYSIDLNSYLNMSHTIPQEKQKKIFEIITFLNKQEESLIKIKNNRVVITENWSITYLYKNNYMTFSTPLVISMIIERNINGTKHILIQKRKKKYKEPKYYNCWEIPQGKVENGELIYNTAKRELLEETGLKLIRIKNYYNTQQSEVFHPMNCVFMKNDINFFAICVVAEASGEPEGIIIDNKPVWISLDRLEVLLKSESFFPLNKKMIQIYLQNELRI